MLLGLVAGALGARSRRRTSRCAKGKEEDVDAEDAALWERFAAWMSARGGDVSLVTFGRPNGIRGLVALRDIAEGEPIVQLPLVGAIELANASNYKDPSTAALAFLRLHRAARDSISEADAPYFDLVPVRGSAEMVSMPDFFTDDELEMLQFPPVVEKTRRRQQLCKDCAAEHDLDAEELQWALCATVQRTFTVLSPVDGLLRLLLPGIDFFNHDSNSEHNFRVLWTLHGEFGGLFKVVAGSAIKRGEEIRICYGGKPGRPDGCGGDCAGDIAWTNDQYLQRYGFVDTSLGTTMVDGKWLVSEEAVAIREALAQTTAEADEALLSKAGDGALCSAARTAVVFRLHLKRALAAQRQSEAAAVAALAGAAQEVANPVEARAS